MVDKTIATLDNELVTVGANDLIGVWDVAAAQYKRAKRSNLVGATITGGGTLATGGFTLTVPATGTAALLGRAQTFTQLQTLAAGLTFGQDTLNAYDEGTWNPQLQFGGAATGIVYNQIAGYYVRVGKLIAANCIMTLANKGTATGNAIVVDFGGVLATLGTPLTVAVGAVSYDNLATTFTQMIALQIGTSFYLQGTAAAAVNQPTLTHAAFANNSTLRFSVVYLLT
jgi:hypothetical protein